MPDIRERLNGSLKWIIGITVSVLVLCIGWGATWGETQSKVSHNKECIQKIEHNQDKINEKLDRILERLPRE